MTIADHITLVRLRDIDRCFNGQLPATVATCSPEGIPNVTFLSIVHRIDDERVALSFQFFNKTRQNLLAHPMAQLLVLDPATMVHYRIQALYERTETEGPVFERMRTNLEAVASQTGMTGIFRLRGADIFKTTRIEMLAHELDLTAADAPKDFLDALATLSARLDGCDELDATLGTCLDSLAELFEYPAAMILFVDESCTRLYTIASRGFPESGIGAEVVVGEGLIGIAALERRPVRVASLQRDRIMAEAVRTRALARGETIETSGEITLPGLPGVQSQLAVPILMRDRALGVLCVQSTEPGRMTAADERALSMVARQLATAIVLQGQGPATDAPTTRAYAIQPVGAGTLRIRYHASDDSVFVDDAYLIKGVPGRILVRILTTYERDGRVDFTNRELRLDESLKLGGYRDNLEARLILLRRRLEDRCAALRLAKTGRGRFRLELSRRFELIHCP